MADFREVIAGLERVVDRLTLIDDGFGVCVLRRAIALLKPRKDGAMNDNNDFREVPAMFVDTKAVEGLREKLIEAVLPVMRPHMEAGRGNDAILEWLNTLAVVLGNCFLGCEFDPRVFEFFRMALVAQLTTNGMTEEGVEARVKGNDAVPAWLADQIPHCTIDEPEFRRLVAGQPVIVTDYPSKQPVYLLLKDIGFDRMAAAIADATSRHDETRNG